MRLKLEEKDNKKILGLFPSALDEARRNIRTLESMNAEMVAPDDEERKLILANKKYIRDAKILIEFGKRAFELIQTYDDEIDDNAAIIFVLKGLSVYHYNLLQEADRAKKRKDGVRFFYLDENSQIILVGHEDANNNTNAEDLSYRFNNGYSKNELKNDTDEAVALAKEGLLWVSGIVRMVNEGGRLIREEKNRLRDIVRNGLFMGETHEIIRAILKKSIIEKDYEVCQGLVEYYNAFLTKFYNDCWAFKVDNNL